MPIDREGSHNHCNRSCVDWNEYFNQMKLWQFHYLSYLKETRLLPPSSHPPTVVPPTTIVALTVPVTLPTPPQPCRTPRPHPPDDRIPRQFPFPPHYQHPVQLLLPRLRLRLRGLHLV